MPDDILKEAQEAFQLCSETEADNRANALDDIRFARLEEQWPERVKKQREIDGRPCLTYNKLGAFRRQVVNDARQNRPSIKVHPVDDQADPQVAEVYSGLIRNIEVTSDADVAYDTALEAAVDSGFGYFRINTAYADDDSFDLDLVIQPVYNQFSVYGDPYDVGADSSNWNLAFVVDAMKKDVFEAKYRGADAASWDSSGYGSMVAPWLDGDMVMVAEHWTREEVQRQILLLSTGDIVGADVFKEQQALFQALQVQVVADRLVPSHKVTYRLMSGCEVLEENDWVGKYIPIIPVYGDTVYIEGRRVLRSLIRSAKDSQQDYNFQRTAYTERVALSPKVPFIGPKGSFRTDVDKWTTANTENHSFIEYDVVNGGTPPQRQPGAEVDAGAMQGAMMASDDMKAILGLHDASMGAQDNSTSGAMVLERRKEGDVATFHFADNQSRAIRQGGRVLIDLIPKVFTGPRILRTMGRDGIPAIIPVNQPVVPKPQPPGAPPASSPQYVPTPQGPSPNAGGAAAPVPAPGGPPPGQDPGQPDMQGQMETLEKVFDLTAGKYDLVVETGPSFATKREEAANQMIALAQAFPQLLSEAGDIIAKNLDWPGADELGQRFNEIKQQQSQSGGNPKGQAEAQAIMAKMQAETQAKSEQMAQQAALDQQKAAQDHELAMTQAQNEAELAKYKADQQIETQRWLNEQTMQLKREQAAAELQLARESADQSFQIELAEAASRADRTVETPTWSVGGGIG